MWKRGQNVDKKHSKESFNSYNKKTQRIDNENNKLSNKQNKSKYKNKHISKPQQKPTEFVNSIYKNIPDECDPQPPSEFLEKMRKIANIHPDCISDNQWYYLRKKKGSNKIEYSDDGTNFVPYVGQPFTDKKDNIVNSYDYPYLDLNHYVDEEDPYYMSDCMILDYDFSDDSEDDDDSYFSEDEY